MSPLYTHTVLPRRLEPFQAAEPNAAIRQNTIHSFSIRIISWANFDTFPLSSSFLPSTALWMPFVLLSFSASHRLCNTSCERLLLAISSTDLNYFRCSFRCYWNRVVQMTLFTVSSRSQATVAFNWFHSQPKTFTSWIVFAQRPRTDFCRCIRIWQRRNCVSNTKRRRLFSTHFPLANPESLLLVVPDKFRAFGFTTDTPHRNNERKFCFAVFRSLQWNWNIDSQATILTCVGCFQSFHKSTHAHAALISERQRERDIEKERERKRDRAKPYAGSVFRVTLHVISFCLKLVYLRLSSRFPLCAGKRRSKLSHSHGIVQGTVRVRGFCGLRIKNFIFCY